ncbi:MAG: hypothetical protein H6737_19035 [Alphaproteobacteria bacterium]|nr:hypothetical protein [Alphaproteobacteria bacterium]
MSDKQYHPAHAMQMTPTPAAQRAPQAAAVMPDNSFVQSMMDTSIGGLLGGWLGGDEEKAPAVDEKTAADRKAAADELGYRFKIVQNESEADGNAVTKEQFDEIVAMYSDIRMGKSNIEIGGDLKGEELEAFKKGTMNDLGRILQTESGREMLKEMMHAKDKDGNALKTQIKRSADPNKPETEAHDLKKAQNGTGSGATIEYRPGEHVDAEIQDQGGSWGNGWRSDVALYHELAHAHHMQTGELSENVKTEELNTVGMGSGFAAEKWKYFENRYRHERRMIGHGMSGGVVDGDEGMAQRDNFKGGEGGGTDWEVPYTYADDKNVPYPGTM